MNASSTLYFLMGLGLGVGAAILYAPKSGPNTRDFLRRKSGEGATYVKQTATDAIDRAKQKASELRKTAADTIDKATQTVTAPMES